MTPFRTLPAGHFTLRGVSVPACLLGGSGDMVRTDISIRAGRITERPGEIVEMGGAMVLPCFVDMHTHLDKGHIWSRRANPDGTFPGALAAVAADRAANWSAADVRARMDFALRAAFAHGTRAVRTHLDSLAPQDAISWPVFAEMREAWKGRIDLQASCLVGIDTADFEGRFLDTVRLVMDHGGVLGMVTYPCADLDARLRKFLAIAMQHGLDIDFHVDETMDATVETLRAIALAVSETGYQGRAVVGHCCSLSAQDEARALDTLDLVARAGIAVVSLPMCNLYLQDRAPRRTPRRRGVTLVHEMKARGIPVAFASDNTRDPFYAYGDLDMVEVMREATRICHLDHSDLDWPAAFFGVPAGACGFEPPSLLPGEPADMILFKARNWTEFFSRPQSDRIVLRHGAAIDTTLPDYAELDPLMEHA